MRTLSQRCEWVLQPRFARGAVAWLPDPWPFCVLLLVSVAFALPAQIILPPHNKSSQWFAYSGDHAVRGKWALHIDGGWRQTDASTWNQWLLRPGLNYQVSRKLQLSAAYAYFMTHPGGLSWATGSSPEHRFQQQLQIKQPIRKLPLRHRFRADQRWLGSGFQDGVPRSWTLQHRARYLIRSDVPLKKVGHERTLLSFGAYNEVFWRWDEQFGSAFDQNRFFAGFTYRPSKTLAVDIGAFHQRLQPLTGGRLENNVVLVLAVSNTAPLRALFGHRREAPGIGHTPSSSTRQPQSR